MLNGVRAMTDDLNFRQEQAAIPLHEAIVPSEETHRLLLLSLSFSLLSTLLAIFVTIESRRESKAAKRKTEAANRKKDQALKNELQELHKEIALLKKNRDVPNDARDDISQPPAVAPVTCQF